MDTAEILDRPTYDQDVYAWALDQAARLRAQAELRPNEPIDWEHVAEEVEDVATRARKAVFSQARRAIDHLLKLQHSSRLDARRGWRRSVDDAREELAEDLTPVLRRDLEHALPDLYRRQRKDTHETLIDYGEREVAAGLPAMCPYTLEQILDATWFPVASAESGAAHAMDARNGDR